MTLATLRRQRGVSTAVVSFIMATVILAIFTYIFINTASSIYSHTLSIKSAVKYSQLHEIQSLVLNRTRYEVRIQNIGPSDIVIDAMILRDFYGSTVIVNPANISSVCYDNKYVIRAYDYIRCSPDYEYVAVVTKQGSVIQIYEPILRAYALRANTTQIISITFNISDLRGLVNQFNVPRNFVAVPNTNVWRNLTGMQGDKLLLLPLGQQGEYYNIPISTRTTGGDAPRNDVVPFGVLVVGYDPSWVVEKALNPDNPPPPRFSIMIAFPRFGGNNQIDLGGGRNIPLSDSGRILIRNFTGIIRIYRGSDILACSSSNPSDCAGVGLKALGTWYYGSTDTSINLYLYLNGTAAYVARFMRIASTQANVGQTSYFPYLFLGDVDGNGVNDIVFVTEDAYYGSTSTTDDYYREDLSDWSTAPIILRLNQIGWALGSSDGSIDGGTYSGIALYMNIFFHDNSHPDENQLSDNDRTDWVLRILLVDQNNNTYIIREFRYQEICNYHKTRITNFANDRYYAKISQSIYVPLPSTGRYWIAIAFQDPYQSGGTNDVDFTVGVEFISAIPFAR